MMEDELDTALRAYVDKAELKGEVLSTFISRLRGLTAGLIIPVVDESDNLTRVKPR